MLVYRVDRDEVDVVDEENVRTEAGEVVVVVRRETRLSVDWEGVPVPGWDDGVYYTTDKREAELVEAALKTGFTDGFRTAKNTFLMNLGRLFG